MRTINRRDVPKYAYEQLYKSDFRYEVAGFVRRCNVYIMEEDAVTCLHPESFDVYEVYGNCELFQIVTLATVLPITISKYEFKKNWRSFEQAAVGDY